MKSRCPNCQTVFRITPEQMKARAGKVRCGQCQAVFNALDSLLEEEKPVTPVPTPVIALAPTPSFASTDTVPAPAATTDAHEPTIVATAPFFAEVAGNAPPTAAISMLFGPCTRSRANSPSLWNV